jgi:hypothetical protein
MARQILVHPINDKKNGDSFGVIHLNAEEKFGLAAWEVRTIVFPLALETVNVLEKQTLNFIWTIAPGLAKHGVLLTGASWKNGKVTVYLTSFKDVTVKEGVTVIEGMAVESVLLRTTDIGGVLDLNKLDHGGVEL